MHVFIISLTTHMEETPNENNTVPARSAGGKARAASMTPEERKEAARQAVLARWGSPEHVQKAIFGSPEKPLKIGGNGGLEIPCYVLEDGTRVLVQGGMIKSLGMSSGGAGGGGGDRIAKFFNGKLIKPFISAEILDRIGSPIKFKAPSGSTAYGYDAKMLVDICEAILTARDQKALQPQQLHIAKQCEILVRGFAKVGIIALVDEATGYQDVRDREALQIILDKILTDEYAKWTKIFPDDYYKEMFRLNNMQYPPKNNIKPSFIGHWTNDIVYSRITPGLLAALREKNPKLPSGNRARKFHQHFTSDFGNPELKRHLDNLIFLMRGCSSWKEFINILNKTSPKRGSTIPMLFPPSKDS